MEERTMKKIGLIGVVVVLLGIQGCSQAKNKTKELNLTEIHTQLLEQEELVIPTSMVLTQEEFTTLFGVDENDIQEVIASRAMMSAQLCDIIMIQTKDNKKAEVLEAIKTSYDEMFLYPFMTEFVKEMQVIEYGDYILVIVAENAKEIRAWIESEIQ